MGTPSPAELMEALRDWGCDPKPHRDDWATHNRGDDWHTDGVTHHHTAGSAKLLTSAATQEAMRRLLWTGRITDDPATTLHGPLCQGNVSMIGDTGRARIWLIGYGIANHAGKGSSRTLARVRAGTYDGQEPGPDDADGNPRFFGLEYSHPGDGKTPWPNVLLDVGARAACAFCEASGWPQSEWPGRNVEHREWTTRKIDRAWPGDLRAAIARTSQEKDAMAVTDAQWAALVAKVDGLVDDLNKVQVGVGKVVANTWGKDSNLFQIETGVKALQADVVTIGRALTAHAAATPGLDLSPETIALLAQALASAGGDALLVEAGRRLITPAVPKL